MHEMLVSMQQYQVMYRLLIYLVFTKQLLCTWNRCRHWRWRVTMPACSQGCHVYAGGGRNIQITFRSS